MERRETDTTIYRAEGKLMRQFCKSLVIFIVIVLTSWLSSATAQVVNMPDENLAAVVRDTLGLAPNARITRQALQRLTSLDARSYRIREITGQEGKISSITGLEHATQLTELTLIFHQIQDIAPLAGLTQLKVLEIAGNPINNFQPLAKLRQIQSLSVSAKRVRDLHQHIVDLTRLKFLEFNGGLLPDLHLLKTLPHLESLSLYFDAVNDLNLQSLVGLIQLKSLSILKSQVRDVSPLAKMTHLEGLYLVALRISDIRPLAELTQLRSLSLSMNEVSDIRPLAELKNLRYLQLTGNQISDVSPLAGLVNLESLLLQGNPIQEASPLAALTKLRYVDIKIPATPVARIIPDPNLAAVVRDTLGLAPNSLITRQTLQRLTSLNAASYRVSEITGQESKIRNISGLEHATRLTELWLPGNQIRDIGPLAGLTQLRTLDLENNQIRDIGPLAGLTQLRTLNMWNNPITDFRPLTRLKQLSALVANVRQVRDLQDHVDLIRLTELQLNGDGQQIRDTHLLANLTQLTILQVSFAQVRDLSFLRNLTRLEKLSLRGNQLSDLKPIVGLKQLKRLYIHNNQIRNLQPLTGLKQLTELDIAHNQVHDVSPLAGLVNLEDLRLIGNPIQDASPLSNLPKLRYVDIEIPGEIVNIPDANLAAAVRKALGLGRNAPITKQAMQRLTELDARESQIKNLMGLEHATRLRGLEVRKNQIRNIRPLAKLKSLQRLILDQNSVSDISPIANMTQLTWLLVGRNPISDFTPLANLNQLERLALWGSNIGDVTLLANKTKLTHLWLGGNNISNIAPLANLTQLKVLELRDNRIRNVNPLVNLKKLEELSLRGNPIQDLSPLRTLLKQNPNLDLDIRPDAGPKIEGPWVWMIAPTGGNLDSKAASFGKDWLSAASGGSVTEQYIATNGAIAGDAVGNKVWTLGTIAPKGSNNITEMANAIGLGNGDNIEYHVAYGSISLDSPRKQNTTMYVGSDDAVKVWLNGVLVYNNASYQGAHDYQDTFSVTLKQGRNILLVAVYNGRAYWSGFFGFEKDAVYSLTPSEAERPQVVSIPDRNLAAAVRKALNLGPNAPITKQAMQRLTELDAKERQIGNLTGLEHATQLTGLELWRNQIRNLTPLANLTQLRHLGLDQNQISDIRPITRLTQLESLRIGGNQIDNTGIRPLISLQQLEWLSLYGNQIRNIEPLSNLTKLQGLWLSWNQIRDVSPLAGLRKLKTLHLAGNPIQDMSPLQTLLKQNPKLELDIHLDAGPKIEGPWVWMIAPTGGNLGSQAAGSGKDWLAAASGGSVTEQHIATNGATPGAAVGNKVWTSGKLAPTGNNNIAEMVKAIGLGNGNYYIEHHVAYGSLSLYSPRKQNTTMYVGSDDAVKVWLNGVLVHNNPADREAHDYQDTFSVTLKQGRNILLVAVYNGLRNWIAFFGFEKDAVYSLAPTAVVHIGAAERPPIYWIDTDNGTLRRLIGDEVENLLPGVQNAISLTVAQNKIYWTEDTGGNTSTVKRANLEGSNVRVLATLQSVPTSITVDTANSKLYWTNSRGRIQTVNFNGGVVTNLIQNLKEPNTITLDTAGSKLYWGEPDSIWRADLNGQNREVFAPNLGELWSIAIAGRRIYSIERPAGEQHWQIRSSTLDGLTPTQTLATLQSKPLGLAVDTTGGKLYWMNADGKIQRANLNGGNIQNVVTGLRAPKDIVLGIPTPTNPAAPGNTALVAHLPPVETQLLANYPNPFNPETWIPYELATDTNVQILIYDGRGSIVRRLGLGHQLAGTYTDRSQAAYWDGRNTFGEPVASGLYFYQLQTDTVSLLQKMLIVK